MCMPATASWAHGELKTARHACLRRRHATLASVHAEGHCRGRCRQRRELRELCVYGLSQGHRCVVWRLLAPTEAERFECCFFNFSEYDRYCARSHGKLTAEYPVSC